MKSKCILYFLAVGFMSAAPAFADRIAANAEQDRDRDSVSIHELLKTSFAQPTNVSDRDGKSIHEVLFGLKENKSKGEEHFILFDSTDKNRDKHKPKKQEGDGPPASFVAVPEPGSLTLVLFGLGALGILLYRRNSL